MLLVLSGCASSGASSDALQGSIKLGDLPPSVRAELARGTVKLPKGPLNAKQAASLLKKIRRSELRKHGALGDAVASYDRKRRDLATRGKRAKRNKRR